MQVLLESPAEKLRSYCGSPHYAAPELFGHASYEGPPVDLWAIGVMLYVSILGSLPFESNDIDSLIERVTAGCFVLPPVSNALTHACTDMLYALLEKDASIRWNAVQFMNCEWLENCPPINNRLSLLKPNPKPPGPPTSLPPQMHVQQLRQQLSQTASSVGTLTSSSTPSSPRISRRSRTSAHFRSNAFSRTSTRKTSVSLTEAPISTGVAGSSRTSAFSMSASSPFLGLQRRLSSRARARDASPRILSTRVVPVSPARGSDGVQNTGVPQPGATLSSGLAPPAPVGRGGGGSSNSGSSLGSNLRATSAGSDSNELRRSLREITKERLVALGMPAEKCRSDSLMNPRQSLTGSFRIMLHRAEVNEFEKSGVDFPTSWIRPNKGLEKNRSSCSAPQPLHGRGCCAADAGNRPGASGGRWKNRRRVGAEGTKPKSRKSAFCTVM